MIHEPSLKKKEKKIITKFTNLDWCTGTNGRRKKSKNNSKTEREPRAPSVTALEKRLEAQVCAIFYTITNGVITTRWICSLLSSYHRMGVVDVAQICNRAATPFSWCHFDSHHETINGEHSTTIYKFVAFHWCACITFDCVVLRKAAMDFVLFVLLVVIFFMDIAPRRLVTSTDWLFPWVIENYVP